MTRFSSRRPMCHFRSGSSNGSTNCSSVIIAVPGCTTIFTTTTNNNNSNSHSNSNCNSRSSTKFYFYILRF